MTHDKTEPFGASYALGQLAKAMSGTGKPSKVDKWLRVLSGMRDGSIRVGSRTPTRAPGWVSLEVVHGGFATGRFAAQGPLQPHERDKLALIPCLDNGTDRATLNLFYVSDAGRGELAEMLSTGHYRVRVPEEGALLVLTWLMQCGEAVRAKALLDELMPWFGVLRFYPVPHTRPLPSPSGVFLTTVGDVVKNLRASDSNARLSTMVEAIQIWAPLYDRCVALFHEVVNELVNEATNEAAHKPALSPHWLKRARAALDEYARLRKQHRQCAKPDRPKENFARLRRHMADALTEDGHLSPGAWRDVARIVSRYITSHGAPGSQKLQAKRKAQKDNASRPSHRALARTLADRLSREHHDEGTHLLPQLTGPVTPQEATALDVLPGWPMPPYLVGKARRCWSAPLEQLLSARVIASAESIATVLPTISGHACAQAIDDTTLQCLYRAVYGAFRRRRSLLLLNLASQVQLTELPWIAAIRPWVEPHNLTPNPVHATLVRVAALAIQHFPHTALPNKLGKELRALTTAAGVQMPIVDELAADIFMGEFSKRYVQTAQVAAAMLEGSLYERYYGVPFDKFRQLTERRKKGWFRAKSSTSFADLCTAMAGADTTSFSVAANGMILEQSQIVTTHNLASMFNALDLATVLGADLRELPRDCFTWICRRMRHPPSHWYAELHLLKNAAYAWRQMLFYLTRMSDADVTEFLDWSRTHLASQPASFVERFRPAHAGLIAIAGGASFDDNGVYAPSKGRRFLGWTRGRHWMSARPES